jgi:hypothetical protein
MNFKFNRHLAALTLVPYTGTSLLGWAVTDPSPSFWYVHAAFTTGLIALVVFSSFTRK